MEPIANWPIALAKKQVQSFIDLANYYNRFVEGFSDIVSAITDLCIKNKRDTVIWTDTCQKRVDKVKRACQKHQFWQAMILIK